MKHRILLVDDNEAIHDIFTKILCQPRVGKESITEIEIDSTQSGEEALLVLKASKKPYTIAIVDMRMPGWNGLETVQKLWEVDANIQIIICTAYSDFSWPEISNALGQNGNYLILKKPFDHCEILQLVSNLIMKWELSRVNAHALKNGEIQTRILTESHLVKTMSEKLVGTELTQDQKSMVETIKSSSHSLLSIANDFVE